MNLVLSRIGCKAITLFCAKGIFATCDYFPKKQKETYP
jgi:hypothetical protein